MKILKSQSKAPKRSIISFITLLTCASVSSCSILGLNKGSQKSVSITFLPNNNPNLIKKKFKYFKSYLEKKLQKKVTFKIPSTYQELANTVNSESYEIAQINPVIFSRDFNPKTMESFATELEGGETSYRSVIIVKPKSSMWTINDLNGKVIGMNNKLSTSGYVIPTYILKLAGLRPNIDYQYKLLGSHAKSINAVINGTVDASAVSWATLKSLINNNMINGEEVRIIEVSMRIPNDVWILRKSLKKNQKERIREAFFSLQNKEGKAYLGVDGFVPVDKDEYEIVRIAGEEILK